MEEFEEAEGAGEAAISSSAVVDIPTLKKRSMGILSGVGIEPGSLGPWSGLEEVIRMLAAGKEAIRKQGCTSKELREELVKTGRSEANCTKWIFFRPDCVPTTMAIMKN